MTSTMILKLGLSVALVVAVLLLHPDGALIFLGPPVLAILSRNATMTRRAIALVVGLIVALVTTLGLTAAVGIMINLTDTWQTIGSSLMLVANVIIPAYVTYECLRMRPNSVAS